MPTLKRNHVDDLLNNWEEVYKKGLLSFWILLLLHGRRCYAYEMAQAVREASGESVEVDENSIYRALNRFESLGIVSSRLEPSAVGPARRYYQLTEPGLALLRRFIQRNILILQSPQVNERILKVLNSHQEEDR